MQPTSTRQLAANHGVKLLVYGPAGVGKTTLMATAPAPLLISAESGLLSLRNVDVPAFQVETLADLYTYYNWIKGSQEAQQYQTIGLDSISEIGETCLSTEKGKARDPRQAYGELVDQMMLLMRAFRDLPGKHVYFSAKMEHYQEAVTGIVKYQPSMPGKQLGPAMPYMFDEVFYMGIGKDEQGKDYRYLQTALDHQHDAKDRSGALDPIEPPDLNHIFTKIQGA